MLISSIFIGGFGQIRNQGRILGISLLLAGISYIMIGPSSGAVLITISAFGFFLMLPFINTSLEVLLGSNISNWLQGRVWSTISLVSQSGMLAAFGIVSSEGTGGKWCRRIRGP